MEPINPDRISISTDKPVQGDTFTVKYNFAGLDDAVQEVTLWVLFMPPSVQEYFVVIKRASNKSGELIIPNTATRMIISGPASAPRDVKVGKS